MKYRRIVLFGAIALTVGLGSAWAQIAVTDRLTTTRNAIVAVLKTQIVDVARAQQARLTEMAKRLTNLDRFAAEPPSDQETSATLAYGDSYRAALRQGDEAGAAFDDVARSRLPIGDALSQLPPEAREAVEGALATLDAADSSVITGTHQVGMLRANERNELSALNALEADVINPSASHGATAVLDKISGAGLLETRQKQARLQYLAALVEQLVIDNKRARDTEAALLNMQLRQLLRAGSGEGDSTGMLDGAANDLRTWRQP